MSVGWGKLVDMKKLILPILIVGALAFSGCAPAAETPAPPVPTATVTEQPGTVVVFSEAVDPGVVLSGGEGVMLPADIPAGLAVFPSSLVEESVFFDKKGTGQVTFTAPIEEMELLFPAYEELGFTVTPASDTASATASSDKFNVMFTPGEGEYTLYVFPVG